MAVREFNGSTDFLKCNVGSLSAATFGTFGAIFKVDDTAVQRSLMVFLNSGNTFQWAPLLVDGDDTIVYFGTGFAKTAAAIPQGVWLTMIVRKATGTTTPRFSYYNHTTTTWTHANATSTTGDGTATGGSGFLSTATTGGADESHDGRLAVTAGWSNAVHWSADSTGDAQIEAAGLHTSLQNWVDESPDMLIPWDPTVGAGIADIIGAADQATISGTTQVVGDDPPGFTFTLGDLVVPTLFVVRSPLQLR